MAKILIAEDSTTVAAALRKALAPLGHTILVVTDGQDAQRCIESERPDLIILDIVMPTVNGFEICRSIRSNPETCSMPIIVVTAMGRERDRYWGLKQGADEYLVKPIDDTVLMDTVRRYLQSAA